MSMGGPIGNLQMEKQKQAPLITVNQQIQEQQQVMPPQMQQKSGAPKSAGQKADRKSSVFDKAKKEDVYALPKSRVRDNFSDERVDAFHDVLRVNSEYDSKLFEKRKKEPAAAGSYRKMMEAISEYAKLSPVKTKRADQAKALRSAQKAIAAYQKTRGDLLGSGDEMKQADEVAARYKLYFETFTNGTLQDRPGKKLKIDATKNAPAINTTTAFAITYSDRRNDALFPHEPSMNDIEQRALGDCYLQAGISALVMNHPEKLKEGMRDNGDGTVTVRFFKSRDKLEESEKEALVSERINDLWKNENYSGMNDEELMFKLLQHGNDENIKDPYTDRCKASEQEELDRFLQENADRTIAQNERNQLKVYFYSPRLNLFRVLQETEQLINGEKSLDFARYLLQNAAVKEKVLDNMREQLSQPDVNPETAFQQALFRLKEFIPATLKEGLTVEDKRQNVLNRDEFNQKNDELAKTDLPDMVPIYVTVTKEVPAIAGHAAYSSGCLWMQMLEKAYAASGLHDSEVSDLKAKQETAQADLRAKLQKKGISGSEIEREVNKLAQKQAAELETMKHSFKNIEGGWSGRLLETFTGEKNTVTKLDYPSQMLEQIKTLPDDLSLITDFQNIYGFDLPLELLAKDIHANLQQKFVKEYTPKKSKEKSSYIPSPIYIEDIEETIEAELAKQAPILKAMLEGYRNAGMGDCTMQQVKEFVLNKLLTGACKTAVHRPMSGKYTDFAVEQYEKIQQALDHGLPVNIGTKRFLPEGMKASGKNGESEQGGLVENHAYSVVGVMEKDGNRFVKLRNPWAEGVLQYTKVTQPDGSVSYTSRKISGDTRGMFYMELNDFLSKVSHLDINGKLPPAPQPQQAQQGGNA